MGERWEMGRPLVDSHLEVWKSPDRRIHTNAYRTWKMGIRLRPPASGAATNWVQSVVSTPPALRETSVRELMVFLQAPGHIGFRPKDGNGRIAWTLAHGKPQCHCRDEHVRGWEFRACPLRGNYRESAQRPKDGCF